jgi:hypothetical protein
VRVVCKFRIERQSKDFGVLFCGDRNIVDMKSWFVVVFCLVWSERCGCAFVWVEFEVVSDCPVIDSLRYGCN